ncbi:uncharacterized protein [Battus philenor]|uniref:uncharacterized protein n=1 Tax=Battus philenor TaxID=42288 RepID=UPI0035D038A5
MLCKMTTFKWLKNFSRVYSNRVAQQTQTGILSRESFNEFIEAYPVIMNKTLQNIEFLKSHDRINKVLEYNTRKQKQLQAQMFILSCETLQKPDEINDDFKLKQHVIAWCIEMLFTYAAITDDFEEGSKTRYSKPCWHLLPEVGKLIINDAGTILCLLYEILRQNFEGLQLIKIFNLFNETMFKYNVGQHLDIVASTTKNYEVFTVENYLTIASYKLGFYSLVLPVQLALILSNKNNSSSNKNVSDIFTEVGVWSQIKNDFEDIFDDDASTGKTGSDIQAGKCTWLAVTALQRCSEAQRKEFEECYGSWDPSHVDRIRALYNDLKITDIFHIEEKAYYDNALLQPPLLLVEKCLAGFLDLGTSALTQRVFDERALKNPSLCHRH